jgi:ketosteroid isomerase-like protein
VTEARADTETTREVVERMYQAGIDADPEAFMALIHEDIELIEPAWLPYGGVHRGIEGIEKVFVEVAKIIDLSTIEVTEIIAEGDTAIGFFRAKLHSGAEISNAERWTVREGKIWRGSVYYQDPTPVQEMLRSGELVQ